jgi:hypothetical protein
MVKEFVPEMRSDKKDAEIARLREQVKKLKALIKESLSVIDDVQTKTDVYLGINEANNRANQYEIAALAAIDAARTGGE